MMTDCIEYIFRMLPPLIGDGEGHYKVRIVGNSGSGKTTTGEVLAELLGVPFIALDTLHWQPGWKIAPVEELQTKLGAALNECDRGWVVDGNYSNRAGDRIIEECTDIIWLDPPLLLYFPRVFVRTILRLLRLRPPCSPGCPERASEVFFSKDSILWWCISHHWSTRRKYRTLMAEIGVGDKKMRRLGGWGDEQRNWLDSVREMCRAK